MIRTPLQGCGVSRAHCTNATSTDLFRSREMKAHRGSVSSRRVSGWPNIISRAHRSHTGFAQTPFRRGCEAMPLIEVSGTTEVCGLGTISQVLGLYRKHSGATALRDEGDVHRRSVFDTAT